MKGIKNIIFDFNKENLTDSSFKQSITMSVVGIILCMIALCSTTFAWFNASVSSNTNSIQAANCIVTVSVANSGAAVEADNGQYTFEKDKIYEIKITASGSAQSVYCILNINGNAYYTEQISLDAGPNTMTFKLKFTSESRAEIVTGWGTASQEVRQFKDGLYYVDYVVTDPATIETEKPQAETKESAETSESTETTAPAVTQ